MTRTLILLGLFMAVLASDAHAQATRTVRLSVADDIGIIATYYPVEAKSAAAVVLLHDFGQARTEWDAFASFLQGNGIAALTVDLRGHGDSVRRLTAQGPELLDYRNFKPPEFQSMLLDVNAAVDWLSEQPGINPRRIGMIGSGLGANVAVRYAGFNEELAAMVLFSPGIEYNSVRTDDAIKKVGANPLRIYVSRDDVFSFESCNRLLVLRKEAGHPAVDKELNVCTGKLHGAAILKGVQGLPQTILDWLKQSLRDVADEPLPLPPPLPPAPPELAPKK